MPILIIASASADMSGDKYTEKGAIIGVLDHVWSLYPSLIAPPPQKKIAYPIPPHPQTLRLKYSVWQLFRNHEKVTTTVNNSYRWQH